MKIKELEISGFKGIHNLVIHPKQINILVGKNNTGKTSILEAVSCTLGVSMFAMQIKYDPHLSSLINVNAKESRVVVKLEDENKYLLLTKPELKESLPEFRKDLFERIKTIIPRQNNKSAKWEKAEEILDKILSKRELLSEIEKESIGIESAGKKLNLVSYTPLILRELEPLANYIGKEILGKPSMSGRILGMLARRQFYSFSHNEKGDKAPGIISNLALDERFGVSESKSKINEIQKYLQNRKILKNLERFDFDKLLFKRGGKEYEIPYSFMGNGFKALVGLISRTSKENETFLVEEPENHMHPAYVREAIRQIIDFSRTNKIQFFITTHSSDLLDLVLTGMLEPKDQKYLAEELNVIRLGQLDEDIVAQELNLEEAKEELEELRIDLRGR